jgi:hypothetical protein
VTWTKVSLNEAKIRATPKTSSPVLKVSHGVLPIHNCFVFKDDGVNRTIAGRRAQGDVLLGSTSDLLGRHGGLFGFGELM